MTPAAPAVGLEDFFDRLRAVNPFTDNRINKPSAADVDVAEIHQAAFARLTDLARESLTGRRGLGVVLWGEAGVGKSHLLSRLGRWADQDEQAYFVYLHNLQAAPERLPRTLLRAAVSVLTRGRGNRWLWTPLWRLIRGGLLGVVGGSAGFHPWERLHRAYNVWIDGIGASDLPGAALIDRAVFEVLFQFFRSAHMAARGEENGETAALALRWLSGEALEPEEAARFGLRPAAAGEAVALADGEQVKQVFVALSRLAAAAGRPFVLAFDQVDNLDDEQFAALARFLEALIDAAPNLLVVTAGIQATLLRWRETLVIQHSAWDRLAQFEVHPQRLTAGQALRLIRARLAEFLAPFLSLEPIRQRAAADDFFPLGAEWARRHIEDKVDIRPRDVVNWAREGWRVQQEALAHRGGPVWLAGWTGGVAVEDDGPPPTADEVRAAVDRAVADIVAVRAAGVREEPHKLPPDADRLASLVHDLLMQCRDQAPIASVRRIPPPRRGARPSYDLEIVHHGPDNGPGGRTGVLFLTAVSATSATGFLRRLTEESRPLQRLFLVTDARVQLPLGNRGAELLKRLQEKPGLLFEQRELSVAELADLDALTAAVLAARSGDLEAEPRPGRARPVSEREVIESHHRHGRYLACRLLRDLLSAPPASPEAPS